MVLQPSFSVSFVVAWQRPGFTWYVFKNTGDTAFALLVSFLYLEFKSQFISWHSRGHHIEKSWGTFFLPLQDQQRGLRVLPRLLICTVGARNALSQPCITRLLPFTFGHMNSCSLLLLLGKLWGARERLRLCLSVSSLGNHGFLGCNHRS